MIWMVPQFAAFTGIWRIGHFILSFKRYVLCKMINLRITPEST